MESIIEVGSLAKQFKNVRAVDDMSFTVNKGEIYGFLGQNGAGKSTTIRMLLSLVRPTSGSIRMFGKDLVSERRSILKLTGGVIEKPDLYNYLTATENLQLFARLSGIRLSAKEIQNRLGRVGLAERANTKVKTFSQGMKQRLGIAVALVHEPELVILDEPANGLDPQGIADIRQLILHLGKDLNKTVVVSSHLLAEVEQIADRLLIIDKGKKIVEGKISELLDSSKMLVEIITTNNDYAGSIIKSVSVARKVSVEKNKILIEINKSDIPGLINHLVENKVEILSVQSLHSLEHYFLSLTSSSHVDISAN
jgi:ABC-type multidrug transport system ATPase subunit